MMTELEIRDQKSLARQHLDYYMNNCFLGLPPAEIADAWQVIVDLAIERRDQAKQIAERPL